MQDLLSRFEGKTDRLKILTHQKIQHGQLAYSLHGGMERIFLTETSRRNVPA
jgi:hypothetical protein